MKCPFCGFDNLPGAESCETCTEVLTGLDPSGHDPSSGYVSPTVSPLHRAILSGTLKDAGVHEPLVVRPKDTVGKAVALMREARLGAVMVVEDGALVGIFTEADLLVRVSPEADLDAVKIKEVMTARPYHYSAEATIAYALNGMAIWENRHLPITEDGGRLVGSLSVRKVLRYIKEKAGL